MSEQRKWIVSVIIGKYPHFHSEHPTRIEADKELARYTGSSTGWTVEESGEWYHVGILLNDPTFGYSVSAWKVNADGSVKWN